MYKSCELTPEQKYAAEVARVGFMSACPFYAHYFYSEMNEVFTKDIPMAATDGRNIFINPDYLASLKPPERVFVYTHEVYHVVCKHPTRMKHYSSEGKVRGLGFDAQQMNIAQDYVINADLMEQGVGMYNPEWLYDRSVSGEDLAEDVYEKRYKKPPEGGGRGQGNSTFGSSGQSGRGTKSDSQAQANGGAFDHVLPPPVDPVTGKEDTPTDAEFKEAIARAASAAKAVGKMPGSLQRRIDEILEPQVDWREHVRALLTGKMGHNRETWGTLNRRYAALGALSNRPMPQFPGRKGFGADTVAVAIDNSGSIREKEMATFFAEVGGVISDVRPKRVIVIWCDAQIRQIDEARNIDELADVRVKGAPGGGGTSFVPPFEYLAVENITPDTLIYLTDLYGSAPEKPPGYPVVWAATTDRKEPWGDVVRIKVP